MTVTTTAPGATVEIRTGDAADGDAGRLRRPPPTARSRARTEFTFDEPVTARYVLVWVTGLVPSDDGFSADLAEVAVHAAG